MNWFPHYRYSVYPPYYREPITEQEELDKLTSKQGAEHSFLPIKAAKNDQSTSIFYDPLTSHFINFVMKKGNKTLARSLVEQAFVKIKQIQLTKYNKAKNDEERAEIELDPVKILHKAVGNCTPLLQLNSIKRGGIVYQVPVPVTESRARFMAFKWIITESREKERKVHFPEKLAHELLDAANNVGKVVKRKQDLHRQCEANRAYAHYRWG
nr:EOG090X0CZM [Cyclestheria hislopi]